MNPGLSGCLSCLMGIKWHALNTVLGLSDLNGSLLGLPLEVSPESSPGVLGPHSFGTWVCHSWGPLPVREGSRYIMPGKVMRPQASSALKKFDASYTPVCLSKAVFTVASYEPKGMCFHLPRRTAPSVSAW